MCAERGLPHAYAETDGTIDGGQKGFGQLEHDLSARPAVVAASDLIGVGALRGAGHAGIATPRDLGVVSWDDSLIAEVTTPALTSLARRPFEMGQLAGSLLVWLLRGDVEAGAVERTEPAPLVVRGFTAGA